MHEQVCCRAEAANPQLPVAAAFWITPVFCGGMFKLRAKFNVDFCCTCSVILNVTATQYTCSLKGVYCPYWLVWWSLHCSHMCIPVHSPWLPGYIHVMQNVLVILTMARLFLDKPHTRLFIPIHHRLNNAHLEFQHVVVQTSSWHIKIDMTISRVKVIHY